jgi:hypothetical protein
VIFFNHDSTEEIKEFSKANRLTISDRLDIWEIICKPFLDTESEVSDTEYATLASYGIEPDEIEIIRRKAGPIIGMTMEWQYLGHWDLLISRQYRPDFIGNIFPGMSGKKFYWWTMEIATKGIAF